MAICVAAAMVLGFCLSFSVVYHMGKQRIFAMTLDEAVSLAESAKTEIKIEHLPEQTDKPAALEDIAIPVIVLFDEDLACLNRGEFYKLASFVGLAQQRQTERICVAGHAAFSSDAFAGDSLSYLRAKAVKEYLVYCGVAETRIDIEANGYRNPIDTEDVTSFRNRRVELSFN